ncbi:hypothetical protein DFH06DRAFT_1323001 [Mycena polygramma]|nr:hypothetical protein DFH06DRAFT_1323001 [Mycena polygramma]
MVLYNPPNRDIISHFLAAHTSRESALLQNFYHKVSTSGLLTRSVEAHLSGGSKPSGSSTPANDRAHAPQPDPPLFSNASAEPLTGALAENLKDPASQAASVKSLPEDLPPAGLAPPNLRAISVADVSIAVKSPVFGSKLVLPLTKLVLAPPDLHPISVEDVPMTVNSPPVSGPKDPPPAGLAHPNAHCHEFIGQLSHLIHHLIDGIYSDLVLFSSWLLRSLIQSDPHDLDYI